MRSLFKKTMDSFSLNPGSWTLHEVKRSFITLNLLPAFIQKENEKELTDSFLFKVLRISRIRINFL